MYFLNSKRVTLGRVATIMVTNSYNDMLHREVLSTTMFPEATDLCPGDCINKDYSPLRLVYIKT